MKNNITKIGLVLVVIIGLYIYFQQRVYIGYFLAVLAIPYGAYGLFVPYKSAQEYAKKGYAATYSRQLGLLILSLGVLGVLFSQLYQEFSQHPGFLVVLLIYLMMFFATLYILNKRYMKKM